MRKPILAANWKLHKSVGESENFARAFLPLVKAAKAVDIVVAPPFTALPALQCAFADSNVYLAAQNVSAESQGAFTGEVSAAMLADLECVYGIVGHSERPVAEFH